VQTTLLVGSLAIDRRDPDYLPMVVLNGVIGSGPGSRLWVKLREEKGFVYNVNSSFSALKYRGPWRVSADMRAEATGEALRELLDEIRRISDEKVPHEELEDAKRAAAARFALSLEQIPQMLNYAITRRIYGFSADYWDSYPAKIMAVSAEEVQRVARKYIHPDLIQVVAVGDAQKIRGILEKFGPVELHDAGGIQPRAASPRDSKK
jgi:zinc protease